MQILVEYDRARVDDFIQLADMIEEAFPELMVDGIETSTPDNMKATLEDGTELLSSDMCAQGVPDKNFIVEALVAHGVQHRQ